MCYTLARTTTTQVQDFPLASFRTSVMYTIHIVPTELPSRIPSGLPEAVAQPGTTLHNQTVHHLDVWGTASSFKMNLHEKLDLERDDMALYSATLHPDSLSLVSAHCEQEDFKVVCKLTCDHEGLEDLRNEAELFADELESLQGKEVPRCFGYFEGTYGSGKTQIGVLLLERVGFQLRRPLRCLPMHFRWVECQSFMLPITLLTSCGA